MVCEVLLNTLILDIDIEEFICLQGTRVAIGSKTIFNSN